MIYHKKTNQKGFTIIELMIATAVLSTILLLVTVLMINIGSLYYKGINQARVQDNVRSISDEVAQSLQLGNYFNHTTGDNGEQVNCVGSVRYTYVVGVQIGQPAPGTSAPIYQHVLWRDDNPAPGTCSIQGDQKVNLTQVKPDGDSEITLGRALHGAELIAPRSRLSNFDIAGVGPSGASPYSLAVGVAYGDNDLLCSPAVTGSCNNPNAMANLSDYTNGNLLCKGSIGQQFCSTARLNTSVAERLH